MRAHWALKGLFALALLAALNAAQLLLVPVVAAVVLTFVLAPAVHALRRRGVHEAVGAALMLLALITSVAGLLLSVAEPAAARLRAAPAAVVQALSQLDAALASHIATKALQLSKTVLAQSMSSAIGGSAMLILLYFLLASERWMLSRCLRAIAQPRQRALLLGGLRAVQRDIGRYVCTLSIVNVADGAVTGLLLWGLGVPNPLLWAVVVCVLSFVPYVGPLAIVCLLLLEGTAHFNAWPQALAPCLAFVLVHAIETNLVSPWFVGRQLALSPVAVLLTVMFWGWLWGIAGALIAVPLLIGMRSMCQRSGRAPLLCSLLEGQTARKARAAR